MASDKNQRREQWCISLIGKWQKDLAGLETEVVRLFQGRGIYRHLFDIVEANPRLHHGNALYDWLRLNHVVCSSVAVRRLLDDDRNTVSLSTLISSIARNPDVITRGWFVSQYSEESREWGDADHDFDLLAGEGSDRVATADLQARLDAVKTLSESVCIYVDKLVAHKDRKLPDSMATYKDLDNAIDAVGELFERLHVLLNQAVFLQLEPVGGFAWERLFREPWIVDTYGASRSELSNSKSQPPDA